MQWFNLLLLKYYFKRLVFSPIYVHFALKKRGTHFRILLYVMSLNRWPQFPHLGVVGTEQDQEELIDITIHASSA